MSRRPRALKIRQPGRAAERRRPARPPPIRVVAERRDDTAHRRPRRETSTRSRRASSARVRARRSGRAWPRRRHVQRHDVGGGERVPERIDQLGAAARRRGRVRRAARAGRGQPLITPAPMRPAPRSRWCSRRCSSADDPSPVVPALRATSPAAGPRSAARTAATVWWPASAHRERGKLITDTPRSRPPGGRRVEPGAGPADRPHRRRQRLDVRPAQHLVVDDHRVSARRFSGDVRCASSAKRRATRGFRRQVLENMDGEVTGPGDDLGLRLTVSDGSSWPSCAGVDPVEPLQQCRPSRR